MDPPSAFRLPYEILVNIIDHLAKPFHESERIHPWDNKGRLAKRALIECRLVAHSLHKAASDHLFKEIHLDSEEEKGDQRLGDFLELIKAPRGGILRHAGHLIFKAPNLIWRREITVLDMGRWLSSLVDRILDLHRSRCSADDYQTLRLQALSISFPFDYRSNGMLKWPQLPRKLRNSIMSVCCELPLNSLHIASIDDLPPAFFAHLQAKILILTQFTLPIDHAPGPSINFPTRPLPPSALEHLITDGAAWIPCPLRELTAWGPWDGFDSRLISHHASTLETLSIFDLPLSAGLPQGGHLPLTEVLKNATFPRLKKLYLHMGVTSNDRARLGHPSPPIGSGVSLAPFHFHPDVLLDVLKLFTAHGTVPELQNIELQVSLNVNPEHAHKRSRFLWNYSRCSRNAEYGCSSKRRWSDLDDFLHGLLTRRQEQGYPPLMLWLCFNIPIPYGKNIPSSIPSRCFREEEGYWREQGWPTSTVPEILPRLVESFPMAFSYSSSFKLEPIHV